MLIESLSLLSFKVPLVTPFKTALREVTHIHDVIIKLRSQCGLVAYGSAPSTPQITGDDHASIVDAIENVLKPKIVGQALNNIQAIIQQVHASEGVGTNARAAVDIALYDLLSQHQQLSLCDLIYQQRTFGKATLPPTTMHSDLITDYTISVNDTQQMCDDIDIAVKRGYRCLKIKIGNQPTEDFNRLIKIYAHTKRYLSQNIALTLRLDVNQGWNADTTVSIMRELERLNIEFELVEQPVKANDIDGLVHIKQHITTPLMADESAFNLEQVKQLQQHQAVDIINIKLMKAGGLYPAMQIADYCAQHNILCMIGCMLEGSIGVAAAAHLAAAYPDTIKLIDLDGPTLGQYDPVNNATHFVDAHIHLNTRFGLGIDKDLALPLWEG
jgi:o-succinylbenzoate synthase